MTAMEGVSYAMVATYVASFLLVSAARAKESGRSIWPDPAGGMAAFLLPAASAGAFLAPLALWLLGRPVADDPVERALSALWIDIVGHALIVIGACIAIAAQAASVAPWERGGAEPIVGHGLYAISRNPVLVGHALLFLGLFLVLPGLVQGALTVTLLAAIALRVRDEERALDASLGERYRGYTRKVARWIGRART